MISLFCFRLICGMSLCWLLMPRRHVTCGFFRIQHMVALGVAVLATLALSLHETSPGWGTLWPVGVPRALGILLAIVAYAGTIAWSLDRRGAGLASIVCVLLLALAGGAATILLPVEATAADRAAFLLNGFGAAWLLGTALTSMLLGHWYLTATSMPLTPLIRLNQFLMSAALLRAAVVGNSLWQHSASAFSASADTALLLLRLAGLAGPLVAAVLVSRILRYRNTQSATGVLFAGVIMVFMGEMAAMLLTRALGWPL